MRNEDATPVSNSVATGQVANYDRPINPALQRRKPTPDELKAEEILLKLQKTAGDREKITVK